MVQKPKKKGGLGVINMRLQNDALLVKQLHKFYQHKDIPWVKLIWFKYYTSRVPHGSREIGSFWWKDVLRLNILYRVIVVYSVGDGSTVMFWNDLWYSVMIKLRRTYHICSLIVHFLWLAGKRLGTTGIEQMTYMILWLGRRTICNYHTSWRSL